MDYQQVIAIKDQILQAQPAKAASELSGFQADLHKVRARSMIAVGYSRIEEDLYRLELRTRSSQGRAYDLCLAMQKKMGPERVNLRVLKRIRNKQPIGRLQSEPSADLSLPEPEARLARVSEELGLGLSTSHYEGPSGSIGGFLVDDQGEPYLLSCNHVFALVNSAQKGDDVIHPGSNDCDATTDQKVGELEAYSYLRQRKVNEVDAALAKIKPSDRAILGNRVPPFVAKLASSEAPQDLLNARVDAPVDQYPVIGSEVFKIGRTTGLTRGRVRAVSVDNIEIEYLSDTDSKKRFRFNNVIEITPHDGETQPFSRPGDSGSLVIVKDGDTYHALGMIFAGAEDGDEPVSLCCTMKDILRHFDGYEWMNHDD